MRQTIGDFLLRRLQEAGIRHVFGVPGDFNLELLQQLEDRNELAWLGTCNELNGAYAADGYARINGISALIVTHGVGTLSALNGIAGSYSEHVPVICICGAPPLKSERWGTMVHHTLADGGRNNFFRMFAEVTAAQAILTPQNAVDEIDRLLLTALHHRLPVYLELPSDIAALRIEVPVEPLCVKTPISDCERLRACTLAILERLKNAKSPAMLLDMDADRYQAQTLIAEFAEKCQIPVAVLSSGKSSFSEQSPLFAGTYVGARSKLTLRDLVEKSDCLITVGYRRIDVSSGFYTDAIPANAIQLNGFSASVGDDNYQGVVLAHLLRELITKFPTSGTPANDPSTNCLPASDAQVSDLSANDTSACNRSASDKNVLSETTQMRTSNSQVSANTPLCHKAFWPLIQNFLREDDILLVENGTASAGIGGLRLPNGAKMIAQPVWASIGYTLPALLGSLVAESTKAKPRRQILFIGDGSFQMTAQELSTILRHDFKPIIFLINNDGYTIERSILGKNAGYNDIAKWRYSELLQAFSPTSRAKSYVVRTASQLQAVLDKPHDQLMFVEVFLDRFDAPESLIRFAHAIADIDYGTRGPQCAPDAQIQIAK